MHKEDETLNGRHIVKQFKVKKETDDFEGYVRIRQTGYSWFSYLEVCYFLCLSQFELFGNLQFPQ